MGLFGNKKNAAGKPDNYAEFRISMNSSGKVTDPPQDTFLIREDCEFNAVYAAEKKHPHMKVCKVEKVTN